MEKARRNEIGAPQRGQDIIYISAEDHDSNVEFRNPLVYHYAVLKSTLRLTIM